MVCFKVLSDTGLEGLRKTTRNTSKINRSSEQDSNEANQKRNYQINRRYTYILHILFLFVSELLCYPNKQIANSVTGNDG
jgi:hypothetical protein